MGVFGSGQLGRMLALAARDAWATIAVFSPDADSPAGRWRIGKWWPTRWTLARCAPRAQRQRRDLRVRERTRPRAMIAREEGVLSVRGRVLRTAQNRLREDIFLRSRAAGSVLRAVRSLVDLRAALETVCAPAILKTRPSVTTAKDRCIEHLRRRRRRGRLSANKKRSSNVWSTSSGRCRW
ncbi:MAG: hypothetical protein R2856_17625 [Caldilineaceae bacterium]